MICLSPDSACSTIIMASLGSFFICHFFVVHFMFIFPECLHSIADVITTATCEITCQPDLQFDTFPTIRLCFVTDCSRKNINITSKNAPSVGSESAFALISHTLDRRLQIVNFSTLGGCRQTESPNSMRHTLYRARFVF